MKLCEIFYLLTSGEMAQLYTGLRDEDGVNETHQRQLAGSVQLGLTALYTRFNLKQNQLELRLVSGQRDYRLHSKYADNNFSTNEPVRWIADTELVKFKDDILKIEKVITPIGIELELNNGGLYSCFTPMMDTLRVPNGMVNDVPDTPEELKVSSIAVVYKANHPTLLPRGDWFDTSRIEVELPPSHLQALLYFVASRASNPVGMGQEFNSGNQWYQKYELECQRLTHSGQAIDTINDLCRLHQKGFV